MRYFIYIIIIVHVQFTLRAFMVVLFVYYIMHSYFNMIPDPFVFLSHLLRFIHVPRIHVAYEIFYI